MVDGEFDEEVDKEVQEEVDKEVQEEVDKEVDEDFARQSLARQQTDRTPQSPKQCNTIKLSL